MKMLISLSTLLLIAEYCFAQQDALTSTYQLNQLFINPSYAGVNDITSFDLHYRSQWGNLKGAPRTMLLSGNTSLVDNQVGLGVSVQHDNIGVIEKTDINLALGYKIKLDSTYCLSFGLQGGVNALNYNFGKLTLDDPSDEDFVFSGLSYSKPNFGTGIFLSSKNFYLGLSAPRLLKVTQELDGGNQRYHRQLYVSSGLIFDKIQAVKLKASTLVRYSADTPLSFDLGASVLMLDAVWAGLYTRSFNTVGINIFFMAEGGLRLGYSGELATNSLAPSSFSTHEITLGYDLSLFPKQVPKVRYY
ncbi:PorP/SprF family type IX secretion system membrane protein [Imperialibacter roseus]|uniref:PorP/SprF family type IX secretion system membrane protein n=1 Tax=Imperialibacter roseus TaxID=1324217 RepID=A0ABZ0IY07_9BACT|nr:PorP/SprF family type IX secretion system membrane protein [Imperialibacter roseus]WOK09521.1 PorP/SprF family type IX secretion system membrane protein [Imperialibacter roseus]